MAYMTDFGNGILAQEMAKAGIKIPAGRETTARFFRGSIPEDTLPNKLRDIRDEMAHDIALWVSGSRYPRPMDRDGKGWRMIIQDAARAVREGSGETHITSRQIPALASLVKLTRSAPRCGYCQRYAQPADTDGTCPACDGGPCQ